MIAKMINAEDRPRGTMAANLDEVRALLDYANRHDHSVVDTPSMINHQEQRLLELLALDYYGCFGDIGDASVFLGASNRCLASELRANLGHQQHGRV